MQCCSCWLSRLGKLLCHLATFMLRKARWELTRGVRSIDVGLIKDLENLDVDKIHSITACQGAQASFKF